MNVSTILRGGLGNNLFIIATTIAYSLKHGIDYCIPETIEYPHEAGQKVYHSDKLKYCDEVGRRYLNYYIEPFFHYKEIPKFDSVILSGYFQSYKYFQDYRAEILTILNIPKVNDANKIFLHFRLGDYKHLDKFHNMITEEYLAKALALVYDKGHRNIIVFSDEIDLIKQRLWTDSRFTWEFSEGKTPIEDLSLMAACSGGIMSASSFSWWGAYLGNQKRLIVYPSEWFAGEYALSHSIVDLCPPQWQAI